MAETYFKAIRIRSGLEWLEGMTRFPIADCTLPSFPPVRAKGRDIEPASRDAEVLLETTGEIGGRSKSASKGYVGERESPPASPILLPHQRDGTFQP